MNLNDYKSYLDSRYGNEDSEVGFILKNSYRVVDNAPCIVCYKDKYSHIDRREYYPNSDGVVTFHKKDIWGDNDYSASELREFIQRYGSKIKTIFFETYDNSLQEMIDIRDAGKDISDITHVESLIILVGKGEYDKCRTELKI